MEQNTKPKRILTPEQLQKLANSRAKANEARRKNHEIKQFEKEKIKQEREEKYKAVMELKQKKEEQKVVKNPEPAREPDIIDEKEEEEPEPEPVPVKKPPPPKQFIRAKKPVSRPPPEEEEKLYKNASLEMLRHHLYQQTRQRLHNDLFGY